MENSNLLCTPKSEFGYWFYPKVDTSEQLNCRVWSVHPTSGYDMSPILFNERFNNVMDEPPVMVETIISDFNKFKAERPEYYLHPYEFDVTLDTLSNMGDKYSTLFVACVLRQDGDDIKLQQKANKALNWLNTTDFFITPASTKYHESYEYGLLEHTLKVVKNIVDLYSVPKFSSVKLYEAIQVALVHDFCKIDKYEQGLKWQKDENNQWEQIPYFKCSDDIRFPFGHGTASMFIAENLVKLTIEQKLAIRWHMGRWYVGDIDIYDLQYANENYPLVFMLQFADQLAATNY